MVLYYMSRKESRAKTKEKRKTQTCKVYEMKIDKSKLSKHSLHHLNMVFVEAKWLYNHVLTQRDIANADTTIKTVPVKVKDEFQDREFKHISAQMKQSVRDRTFVNIMILSALTKKGYKVGKLKFKSELNSVPLRQYKQNFLINKSNRTIKLEKLEQHLKVRGLEQLPEGCDISNAMLIKKCGDYYFNITTYVPKVKKNTPNEAIGMDFGCETQLTFSDGVKVVYQVPVPKHLKKLDRKIMKGNRKRSHNKRKDQLRRKKVYGHLANKKRDIKNKIVNAITRNFRYVCFQDENIKGWKASGHGKKIQNTAIGGIISDLKHRSHTPIMVDKWFPSTQLCPECGEKTKHEQWQRTYVCQFCGFTDDRDVKSAEMILREGLKEFLPTDRREVKPEEKSSSTFFELLMKINNVKVSKESSLSQEAAKV